MLRDEIQKLRIVSLLENYHDNWTQETVIPLICVMCLEYLKDSDSREKWKIDGLYDYFLRYFLLKLIRDILKIRKNFGSYI